MNNLPVAGIRLSGTSTSQYEEARSNRNTSDELSCQQTDVHLVLHPAFLCSPLLLAASHKHPSPLGYNYLSNFCLDCLSLLLDPENKMGKKLSILVKKKKISPGNLAEIPMSSFQNSGPPQTNQMREKKVNRKLLNLPAE